MDLTITRDRTAIFNITVTQAGVGLDLTGKTLVWQAKVRLSDVVPAIAKSSPSSGIVLTLASPPTPGLAVMTIDPADTVALPDVELSRLLWELTLTDGPNDYPLDSGELHVRGNVIA